VVIPNFNYGIYLEERIDSVLNQSYPVFELILLDDASTDNSRLILERYRREHPLRVKTVYNAVNSGNVFEQWRQGLSLAKGEYVWIAEADDLCEPAFLEAVMSRLSENPEAVLGYTQSKMIDGGGLITSDNYWAYTDSVDPDKWRADYVSSTEEEIEERLSVKNTIPNVSAVVFKNRDFSQAVNSAKSYQVAGDWRFYVDLLKEGGKLVFVAEALNYHRRHSDSVTAELNAQRHYDEICGMQDYVYQLTQNSEYYEKAKAYRAYVEKILLNK
jgi:glycosyltransferase involved in cell wall biosynthesis